MKILICIAACLFSVAGYAQTKLIAFRSHSGSNANFRTAVEKDLFDIGNSNFGIVEREKVDSVIKESKNRIIVSRKFYGSAKGPQRDTLTNANASEFFAATNMQMLKEALHKKYHRAMLDNIQIIGFGNKFKQANSVPKK
ncbi:hypothetical protein [Niastella sp. OAS944]|uniref:hypothetical protein n=1 Tax=Niastella sp. OAS944 TaxID=2664089 RepID=UPI00349B3F89|nr:hypothetical protein [Chitinophagaceae bacterium OAS944]